MSKIIEIIDERETQKQNKRSRTRETEAIAKGWETNIFIERLAQVNLYTRTVASCSSSYIGKTCCHFKTRIEEHIKKDNKSHIFKHLHSTATCFDSYNSLCFKIIDKANSKFDLKIKEALHINWRKPNLNAQQNHLSLTLLLLLSFPLFFFLFLFFFFVFAFLFHLLFLLSLTLIIGIFYRLNHTSLLLYLITAHIVSHLSLSSIIFSISVLIIDIFYCLDCISPLLHLIITHLVIYFIITI